MADGAFRHVPSPVGGNRESGRGPRGARDVLGEIRSGVLAVDDRLPSEFEMAEQYGVSRDVIRRTKES
ncbi:MAG TPA: GntR family transcriptional regulator [Trebonia sp.]|jgi:DNA-binding FadR family transcriptional regulator|nr:GntR family transcriptional regulator [Trebonia sp.]